jgi:hypothetical protein
MTIKRPGRDHFRAGTKQHPDGIVWWWGGLNLSMPRGKLTGPLVT